jgi:hypothetical protein
MNITDVKERARRARPDLPTDPVIDQLVQQYHGPRTVYSPQAIAERIHAAPDEIFATLLLLAEEPLYVVSGHWVFFDERGEQFPLDAEDVASALESKEFFHPLSGDQVFHYTEAIGLVYESGKCLDELVGHGNRSLPPTHVGG